MIISSLISKESIPPLDSFDGLDTCLYVKLKLHFLSFLNRVLVFSVPWGTLNRFHCTLPEEARDLDSWPVSCKSIRFLQTPYS